MAAIFKRNVAAGTTQLNDTGSNYNDYVTHSARRKSDCIL
jgi:hypothetical protein